MIIVSATIAPNPVDTGAGVYVSIEISDPDTWLIDSQELFLTTATGEIILTTE